MGNDSESKLFEDNLFEESYIGIVEESADEQFEYRCKIRVYGKFGHADVSLNKIPTEHLPWAYPLNSSMFGSSSSAGSYSYPKKGAIVRVIFDGDIYSPKYFGIHHVSDKLKSIVKSSYENSQILIFDEDEELGIYYTKNTGLLINLKDSIINIKNSDNSILVQNKNNESAIELKGGDIDIVTNNSTSVSSPTSITHNSQLIHNNGNAVRQGANPIYSAVNGEPLKLWAQTLAAAVDSKLPVSGGSIAQMTNSFFELILSNTVTTSP